MSQNQNNRLFVGNLSFDSTQRDLEEYFSKIGHVQEVVLMKDKFTGRPRGFAFVAMASSADAQKAVDTLHDREFQGRKLQVNIARPRE